MLTNFSPNMFPCPRPRRYPSRSPTILPQTFERIRKDRLKLVMETYKELCQPNAQRTAKDGSNTQRSMTMEEEEAKLIEQVHKGIEFTKKKQKDQVDTMLLLEIRSQRMGEKAAAKAAEQEARAAELARAKALKDAEWQEQKAAMEAKKREEELEAAKLQKRLGEERLLEELRNKERLEKEEKERKQQALQKEAEMRARQEELRAKQEAYTQEQLRLADERKKLMDEKDAARVMAREEQRRCPPLPIPPRPPRLLLGLSLVATRLFRVCSCALLLLCSAAAAGASRRQRGAGGTCCAACTPVWRCLLEQALNSRASPVLGAYVCACVCVRALCSAAGNWRKPTSGSVLRRRRASTPPSRPRSHLPLFPPASATSHSRPLVLATTCRPIPPPHRTAPRTASSPHLCTCPSHQPPHCTARST